MIAMANRYNADLLIEYISVIFEVDDQDRLKALCTYFFAIVERSPKELQKIVKDIEFTAKPNFMSTLAQLLEEGMAKGIEMWDYKKNVITIRNMVRNKISTNLMAEILSITSETVKKIQKELSKEKKIIALLTKKQKPAQIATHLKVNVWLVEVLEEILKEDEK